MIVFMSAAYALHNIFSTENIIKLRMQLIHECGLYSGFYGTYGSNEVLTLSTI